jgi:protein-tyrosine phosphatase
MYKKKILFVCLGNICRSPAAEGVMRSLLKKENLDDKVFVDSAGTIDYHCGECADIRMIKHAARRGYDLQPHRARMFDPQSDFEEFDLIITMDNKNYSDVIRSDRSGRSRDKIFKMTSFSMNYEEDEVPDPYYSGGEGFEYVLDLLEDCCKGILERIKDEV